MHHSPIIGHVEEIQLKIMAISIYIAYKKNATTAGTASNQKDQTCVPLALATETAEALGCLDGAVLAVPDGSGSAEIASM